MKKKLRRKYLNEGGLFSKAYMRHSGPYGALRETENSEIRVRYLPS